MAILHTENLSFTYPNAKNKAINNINISVKKGDFVALWGKSGCGKTTLLKMLKREVTPYGKTKGKVFLKGKNLLDYNEEVFSKIGYILPDVEDQIITNKVWSELSFGLENLKIKSNIIKLKVAEIASYFGIHNWFNKSIDQLSEGQKQILVLASVMVMNPEILILDEPTSKLDPIATVNFINTLYKINQELGITIIIATHSLKDVFNVADKIAIMDSSEVVLYKSPKEIGEELYNINKKTNIEKEINSNIIENYILAMPCPVKAYYYLKDYIDINNKKIIKNCPLSVKEGQNFIYNNFYNCKKDNKENIKYIENKDNVNNKNKLNSSNANSNIIRVENIWFRYKKEDPDILKNLSLNIKKGEIFSILGGNGSGKTTLIKTLGNIIKPYKGKILINGKNIKKYKYKDLYYKNIGYLPQDIKSFFIKDTVKKSYIEVLKGNGINEEKNSYEEQICKIANEIEINHLLNRNPFDLSTGEQQKAALGQLLLLKPEILLLDEPTQGLDVYYLENFSKILKQLKLKGKTIVLITHDIEFAAKNADRCSLFFNGEIMAVSKPKEFLSNNSFYTTDASKIAKGMYKNVSTCKELIKEVLL